MVLGLQRGRTRGGPGREIYLFRRLLRTLFNLKHVSIRHLGRRWPILWIAAAAGLGWSGTYRAREAGFKAIVSARSGETEDSFLADLAVASGAGD